MSDQQHTVDIDAGYCCICGSAATLMVHTRGLLITDQTLYCDRHASDLLARATRATRANPPGKTASDE